MFSGSFRKATPGSNGLKEKFRGKEGNENLSTFLVLEFWHFLVLDLNQFILLRKKIQKNPWKKTKLCKPYLRDISFSCREKYYEIHWFLQYGKFDFFFIWGLG